MNRNIRRTIASMLILIMLVIIIDSYPHVVSAAPKPQLSDEFANISVGDTFSLKVLKQKKNVKHVWSTSDEKIATVNNNGIVQGLSEGTAIITCKFTVLNKNYKLRCEITVERVKKIPFEYTQEDDHQGKIEKLKYTTYSNNTDQAKLNKYVNVYLPKSYDAKDKNKKYNVLYLMHGGGENVNTIFGGPGDNKVLMKIIDNMIYHKEIEPLIIVTPTFYNDGNNDAMALVRDFYTELVKDIIPAVESKYHTYAQTTSNQDLSASRNHRAFAGFSMGSACTWYNFINCLDYFIYFLPLSGDCWELGQGAGGSKPKQTAEFLENVVKKSGYTPNDFDIFCATGSVDIAYNNLNSQMKEMMKLTNTFTYSDDFEKGNLHFMVKKNGSHIWSDINQYIYTFLPYIFSE